MERAFQTALWLLQPEVVFILGDIFDEGKWSSAQAWADDVQRFQRMFRHGSQVQLMVVIGNHDVGFHYQVSLCSPGCPGTQSVDQAGLKLRNPPASASQVLGLKACATTAWQDLLSIKGLMSKYRIKRFEKVFGSEKLFSLKGVNFVMVNSVAMEGDGCTICSEEEAELREISRKLNCSQEVTPDQQVQGSSRCDREPRLPVSAPVLLQHYPLYRASDANCSGEDAAPPEERNVPFEEKYDVLSREASQKLLWWLRPRLVLSGHTHSACEVLHPGGTPEVSVPSFSWRNRNNPSFIMGSLTSRDYALSKCYLPYEDTVLTTYGAAAGFLMILVLAHFEHLPSSFPCGWKLCRLHVRR
ncbi:Metallophosphoesterase 1 [Apodemus speciosus]|uniref:Metallophosphoesterase 1 n=1 Tax=Apodemus speciosus TaxID=105296 RepID=A0ABQ0FRG4_APOSI